VALLVIPAALSACSLFQVTQHNDTTRTGATYRERTLTKSNVTNLRRLVSLDVDGQIYSQPLYVPGVDIAAGRVVGTYNVVVVATANNSVYAFDADSFATLWGPVSLGAAPTVADLSNALGGCAFWVLYPTMGIISTPVIDVTTQRLYAVAKILGATGIEDHLFALDIRDGHIIVERAIGGSASGVRFDPVHQLNRAGLLLVQNKVFVAYAGICEKDPYQGWVFGHDAGDLTPTGVYCTSCTEPKPSMKAGIWQSGNGLASDGTFIYLMTGNIDAIGGGSGGVSPRSRGDSFVRLDLNLNEAGFFTPPNKALWLATCDLDLGSAGPVVLPDAGTVLGGGKEGIVYFLDLGLGFKDCLQATDVPYSQWPDVKTRLQNVCQHDPQCEHQEACTPNSWQLVQDSGDVYSHIHGSPVVLRTGKDAYQIYVWGEEDYVRRFDYVNGALQNRRQNGDCASIASSQIRSTEQALQDNMPGGFLSLSADKRNLGQTAILWGTKPTATIKTDGKNSHGALNATVAGGLYAFDADTLTTLWSSEASPGNALGLLAKMNPPTVANGRVYVANFGRDAMCAGQYLAGADMSGPKGCGQLVVYGLPTILPCAEPNTCGGCNSLSPPNAHQGMWCRDATNSCGRWHCIGKEAITCETAANVAQDNGCGGCAPLPAPEEPTGKGQTCFDQNNREGILVCSRDGNSLICCPRGTAGPGCGPN
jgi:outer membrane protein assembly factor BamB